MSYREITLGELYDFYIKNGWKGSAELIKKQGEEISVKKKRVLRMCAQCGTVSSQNSCPNCGNKEMIDIMLVQRS